MWKSGYPKKIGTLPKGFWDEASSAMAQLSSGTVYVLLHPKLTTPDFKEDPESVWARIEWPALRGNPQVEKIIRLSPNQSLQEGRVIYERNPQAHDEKQSTDPSRNQDSGHSGGSRHSRSPSRGSITASTRGQHGSKRKRRNSSLEPNKKMRKGPATSKKH